MTTIELLMSVSILLGLAILRFGLPLSIIWLIGKILKATVLSPS